jgi:ribosome recycling factor
MWRQVCNKTADGNESAGYKPAATGKTAEVRTQTMTSEEILFDAEERMEKAVNVYRDELRGLRTGRATPALVDSLRVEYYGSPTPLKQLAQISTPDPQQIVIRPYDASVLKDVEKAIRSSDLGMSPSNDGKMIRLQVPPMSGEQRQKMVTRIKKSAEDAKVSCRNIRRDANKQFDAAEKAKEMTEDERDNGKEKVQELLKQYEEKVTDLADRKTKEIMEQ